MYTKMCQHKQATVFYVHSICLYSVCTHIFVHKISIWLSMLPLPLKQTVTVYIEINKKGRDINYQVILRDKS